MKKILVLFIIVVIVLTGCDNLKDSPTNKVEEFLSRYQRLDSDVLEELNTIINKDDSMTEEQKKEYKTLLEKQYQNLSYKINNENIKNNRATIEVEIELYDYETAITNSKRKYLDNQDKTNFSKDDPDNESLDNTAIEVNEISKYIDYKIEEMKKVTNKKKYDITFELRKENGIWKINNLSEMDLKKIHGLL